MTVRAVRLVRAAQPTLEGAGVHLRRAFGHEPIAWRGPIVMSTRDELATAWRELDEGTLVKHPSATRGQQ